MPLSTFIPGTMPFSIKSSTKFFPSLVACLAYDNRNNNITVSENKMTPLIYYSIPGAVKSNSL
jgi:hypothetical protein